VDEFEIGRERWKPLEKYLPIPLLRLSKMCEEFEEKVRRINDLAPYINSVLFQEAIRLFISIVNEYLEIMDELVNKDEKTRNELLRDVHAYMKFLYDKNGSLDLSGTLFSVKTLEQAEYVRVTFLTPAIAFIDAKIYRPLVSAIYESRIAMVKNFINKSLKRKGSMPYINDEFIASKFKIGSGSDVLE